MGEELRQHRIRVEKGVVSQVRILQLRTPYLIAFGIIALLSLFVLIGTFSFRLLIVLAIVNIFAYGIVRFLDGSNYRLTFRSDDLPNLIRNDLYKIKGPHERVKLR